MAGPQPLLEQLERCLQLVDLRARRRLVGGTGQLTLGTDDRAQRTNQRAVGDQRQERGQGELSAIQEVERDFDTQVIAIVTLSDVVEYLEATGDADAVAKINAYRSEYGI